MNRNRRDRQLVLFVPNIWNLHDGVLNGKKYIVNNHAEAANRRLNVDMVVNHSSLLSFMTCFQKLQAGRKFIIVNKLVTGNSPLNK